MRLGKNEDIDFLEYGQSIKQGKVNVSLHPAGHMTGAAQVRLELAGEVAVISGDYKRQTDPTCADFEVLKCHTFVTDSTFVLPIYAWPDPQMVFDDINEWWRNNQQSGRASLLLGYSVGKAQRLLAGVDKSIGPIVGHGAIVSACEAYRECGVELPKVLAVSEFDGQQPWSESMIVAPPSAHGSTWLRRFGNVSVAMASGWMQVRGIRRRRSVDRGFIISDHVDWQDLMATIEDCECENVWVTHGYTEQVVRTLSDRGFHARVVKTKFGDEESLEGSASEDTPEATTDTEDPSQDALIMDQDA